MTSLTVGSISSSSDSSRGTTSLSATFSTDASDTLTVDGDFVAVTLPYAWGTGFSASTSATLSKTNSTGTFALDTAVMTNGGSSLKVCITGVSADLNLLEAGMDYSLEVSGIDTPILDAALYGHVGISAGTQAEGSTTFSND